MRTSPSSVFEIKWESSLLSPEWNFREGSDLVFFVEGLVNVGPSRFPLEEVFVDWDKEETDVPAGAAKRLAKDNCRTSGGCLPFGVCPPFARAVVPPEVTGNAFAGGA
jgi:hypothetical protein